jgi:hypothetical protein
MEDDPSPVALPPSPPIVATLNNTDIKDLSMPETEMKNRQEMANFMLNDDAHDKKTNCDGKTSLPGGLYCCILSSLLAVCCTQQHHWGYPHKWNQLQKRAELSKKSIPDVDVQDHDNNVQSYDNTSLQDAPLEFLAAAPLARPSFANNALKEDIKSKDACGQGKSTLREVRQKLANSSLSNDATDMEAMSAPPLSHIKLLNHNKEDQNQQQGDNQSLSSRFWI